MRHSGDELLVREQLEAVRRPTREALERISINEGIHAGRLEHIPNLGDFSTRTRATDGLIVVWDGESATTCLGLPAAERPRGEGPRPQVGALD